MARYFAPLVLLSLLFVSVPAQADEMDVALSRLTEECPGGSCPDHAAWAGLMSQLGGALAPTLLSPARTTGYRGFYVGFETSITGIDNDADYWQEGTEGDLMEPRNRFVPSVLTLGRFSVRKGLPFGFEIEGGLGHLFNSSLYAWGASLKWSLFEGFREGVPGWVPDIAVRGNVQTITGDEEFNLTMAGVDFILSKPIVIGNAVTISPILGAQLFWLNADSEVVFRTGETETAANNAWRRCQQDPNDWNVSLPCENDLTGIDQQQTVFNTIRTFRARMTLGFQLRYDYFTFASSIQWDVRPPELDIPDVVGTVSTGNQWTLNLGLGLSY